MDHINRTWAEISLNDLEHNYRALRSVVPQSCRFLGVVKADAYGHGAVPISHALTDLGAAYLAVANVDEAMQLRRGGIRLPILILGYTPPEYAGSMASCDLTQQVHSLDYALALEQALSGMSSILNVHLKLDTGMTRIGFSASEQDRTLSELRRIAQLRHLHAEGVFTHFSVADSREPEDIAYTRRQFALFTSMLDAMADAGIRPELRHCCNSGASILYPDYALDMIRPGIATYGLSPSPDCDGMLDLRPIMSLHTTIAQIRDIPAGTAVGYGRTFVADRPMRIAVLCIGYADGLPRALSGRVSFLLHGKRVPGIGRICMDMCMADVSEAPEARVGDVLTVFGYDEVGTLKSCRELTDPLGTISYELLSTVSKRIPRIYLDDGRPSEILRYLV